MYYYILNPAAGNGKINKIQDKLKETLNNLGIAGEFVKTTGRGEATKLAKLGIEKGFNTIVAVGGDNTISEVANALAENTKVVLGVVPAGSTNILSQTLGISSWQEACEVIAARRLETIDLGKIKNKYFITTAEVGFETEIAPSRNETKNVLKSMILGRKILSKLAGYKTIPVQISFDEKFLVKTNLFTMSIINSKPLTKEHLTQANPQDKKLDVVLINSLSKLSAVRNINLIASGNYENYPSISLFRAQKIYIDSAKNTLPVFADGNYCCDTPQEISIAPKALKVIVGKKRIF